MAQWFRYHADALHSTRVRRLPDNLFRLWVNSQCLVSLEGDDKTGQLPPVDECADMLRISIESTLEGFQQLVERGLLVKQNVTNDETNMPVSCDKNVTLNVTVNETFHVKNWKKKQYKSDTSTERVRKHRAKNVTANGTPSDTDQNRTNTQTDQTGSSEFFDIRKFLDEKSMGWAKEAAQGWDMDYLINHYNLKIRKGEWNIPDKPGAAFAAFCNKITKGNPPQ